MSASSLAMSASSRATPAKTPDAASKRTMAALATATNGRAVLDRRIDHLKRAKRLLVAGLASNPSTSAPSPEGSAGDPPWSRQVRPSPTSLARCMDDVVAEIVTAEKGKAAIEARISQLKSHSRQARHGHVAGIARAVASSGDLARARTPICRHCGKEFINATKLAIHVRTHIAITPGRGVADNVARPVVNHQQKYPSVGWPDPSPSRTKAASAKKQQKTAATSTVAKKDATDSGSHGKVKALAKESERWTGKWTEEQQAALVRLVMESRRETGTVPWRKLVKSFEDLTGIHRSEDSLRQYFGRRHWAISEGVFQTQYFGRTTDKADTTADHGGETRPAAAKPAVVISARSKNRPQGDALLHAPKVTLVPPKAMSKATINIKVALKVSPKVPPKVKTASKAKIVAEFTAAAAAAGKGTKKAGTAPKAEKMHGSISERRGKAALKAALKAAPEAAAKTASKAAPKVKASTSAMRSSSKPGGSSREAKLVKLGAIIKRMVKPYSYSKHKLALTGSELIRLSDLNAKAVTEYERLYGHRLRCEKAFLQKLGFRVEEQNMCKTCGKPALAVNCGAHYNNRAAGSNASVTKFNVVYATWK